MIIYLLFLCIIYIFLFKKKKHDFWDKQPVSRDYILNEGIISKNPKFNIILDNDFYLQEIIIDDNKIKIIHKFINEHFTNNYIYSINFLKNSLTIHDDSYNLGLFNKNNDIIGFIHTKPIILSIKNKIEKFIYTDFLCIHKNYRNNNLATILISKVINNYNPYQLFIFKKDTKKLPFNYINNTSYFYFDIKKYTSNYDNFIHNSKIEFLNINNLLLVYNFIQKISKKKLLYQVVSFEDFKKIYLKNYKYILIYFIDSNINSLIIFTDFLFKYYNSCSKTFDIENIYVDDDNYNDSIYLFEYFINYARYRNVDFLTCIEQSCNIFFINYYNMVSTCKIFFHCYNYHLNYQINNNEIIFNYI